MQMDMVFTDNTLQNLDVQRITAGPPSRSDESTPGTGVVPPLAGQDTYS